MKVRSDYARRQHRRLTLDQLHALFNSKPLDELVRLSTHCCDQYRDRFKPDVPPGVAKGELYRRLREDGQFSPSPPTWLVSPNVTNCGYIVIDDEVVVPLREDRNERSPYVGVTCLYRVHL